MARYGNNHRGGRPKGSVSTHTLQTQEAKKYIIEKVIAELDPILDAQIRKAKKGSTFAFKELFERAFGKVPTVMASDEDRPFILQISETIARKNAANTFTDQNS